MINQGVLLNVLDSLIIGNTLLFQLQSYLTSRRHFFNIKSASTDLLFISSGVLSGSHLSPLLFIIFRNSINKYLSSANVLLLANYIKIFLKINTPDDDFHLQSELYYFCVFLWFNLSLNISKHVILVFFKLFFFSFLPLFVQ